MNTGGTGIKLWISLVLGILFAVMGTAATLAYFGINLPLPVSLITATVVEISLIVAGLVLFVDSFSIRTPMGLVKWGSVVIALLLAAIGAIPLLVKYQMLSFLPFLVKLTIPEIVLNILLAFYGLYLLFTVTQLFRAKAMGFY
ncbi:MAG: hypothetical protein KKA65_04595 [Nanoarchaeota archaeon]|nr:hypothetical protein [Nanoarchaeota archaeon]MBU4241988.1 hypothetical protein [Nanoarchaeota archaeon]MBU4352374.1 hypothetical protein [Nanoarchaeota archaeon]MBU4456755.1 hypothetical protein [Nanoarchaeota archaeon]MCG2719407.1 hypothetical protein [Nanoarchaeota archaeon]